MTPGFVDNPPRADTQARQQDREKDAYNMNDTDLIANFATRTLANLDLVKGIHDAGDLRAFEITQLWNSLLGLIVAPRERDLTRLPETPLAQLHGEGWPGITTAGKLE